jgi:hypothetical protein
VPETTAWDKRAGGKDRAIKRPEINKGDKREGVAAELA